MGAPSEWGSLHLAVPQGTKLGLWLFVILIYDIKLWKYVDDTAASQVVPKDDDSNTQQIANRVANWSLENRV